METSVKWNLDEAVEISVLSGMDVIQFEKSKSGESWRYWTERVDSRDGVLRYRDNIRRVFLSKLPALLEKYEAAGCGVLVATERKRTVLEPLKLGEKMVEVSTKKFDWKDVQTVLLKSNGSEYFNLKFEVDRVSGRGRPIFHRYGKDYEHHDWKKRPFEWYVSEVEEWFKICAELVLINTKGETMNYEQN